MLRAFDPTALKAILSRGVERGLWTVEQLDRPSQGWIDNTRVSSKAFKNGYQGIAYRNPLRHQPNQPQPVQPVQNQQTDYDDAAEFPF
jgi:hypothetical protein